MDEKAPITADTFHSLPLFIQICLAVSRALFLAARRNRAKASTFGMLMDDGQRFGISSKCSSSLSTTGR